MTTLTRDLAAGFARLSLGHVGQPYPYLPHHVLGGPSDLGLPVDLHPIFHGSFDWHSCVHSWWQLLTIARLFPDLPEASNIRDRANTMLVPEKVAGELAFLHRPTSSGFERPYGWAWALALHGEAVRHHSPWGEALEPLAREIAARFKRYLPRLTYPIRTGTHPNTAFALILALEWAREADGALADLIEGCARGWFIRDRACQAWEPSGDDFLSPALTEALLMACVLPAVEFGEWFDAFLPDLTQGQPRTLFEPARVSDRSDGKTAHLDGLNLSRAWCWRQINRVLGPSHGCHLMAAAAIEDHLSASLPHLADDYMGAHWLATFALLALLPDPGIGRGRTAPILSTKRRVPHLGVALPQPANRR